MYEYKVETYKVKIAENEMNKLATEGWRVTTMVYKGDTDDKFC